MSTSLRRICLVGIRGVGKSTLIRSVRDRLPDVDVIVGSAVLRELVGPEFARFDYLPPEVKKQYREGVIRWMEDRQAHAGKHILCEGHTSLLDESTGRVGPVFTELDCRFYGELILLEAPIEDVLARRQGDASKPRSLDAAVIQAEFAGERESSVRIAETWNMVYHRIFSGDSGTVADQLVALLTS